MIKKAREGLRLLVMGWTPPEVAKFLGVDARTVRRWARSREGKAYLQRLELIRELLAVHQILAVIPGGGAPTKPRRGRPVTTVHPWETID